MILDYHTLESLRQNHPAWRLLRAQHAPLVASFLNRVFIVPNVRILSQGELVEALEDELFSLREDGDGQSFPGTALGYLNDWANNDKGWLRKFYPPGTDEPHFDLTPATEKALLWLQSLTERVFVGTESRLLTMFELLRQMNEGSQIDPEIRIAELKKRRDDIDREISTIESGEVPLLDDTSLKDRFQQFVQLARALLSDFREVEHNFRGLDRRVRERIALWKGSKGELLEEIMGERDAISDSDQGRSFRAFWDFLMSQSRQEELTDLLDRVLELVPIKEMDPEPRLIRVHYDWLEAGEHTQRTVAKLSEQLRRFLDDQAWLENRRIIEILHSLESQYLEIRENHPSGDFMEIDETSPTIELPMERPLYSAPFKATIDQVILNEGFFDVDTSALFSQSIVDKEELSSNIRRELQTRDQVSLGEVISAHPLKHGLAELVTYFHIAGEWPHSVVDDNRHEEIAWEYRAGTVRQATIPMVILLRS
ncbi:MAG: DUF3375 domain-containing protein [Synergistales bacterium]|nr:DUF3375 domain-containing protein [Synergistales bacterium]